jgi:DNA-binding MarR family transcriptional regulator
MAIGSGEPRTTISESTPPPATMVALLDAIGSTDRHTQRTLAHRLGIALGLTNALLKRCLSKGLVKIRSAPTRRYAYYLTPRGFAEKSRLVTEYLGTSLAFFRRARMQYEEVFAQLADRGLKKVALAGDGDLAEVAILSAPSADVTIVAVIAAGRNERTFHGRPVVRDWKEARKLGAEAAVVTDSRLPQQTYDDLRKVLPHDQVMSIALLHVVQPPSPNDEE